MEFLKGCSNCNFCFFLIEVSEFCFFLLLHFPDADLDKVMNIVLILLRKQMIMTYKVRFCKDRGGGVSRIQPVGKVSSGPCGCDGPGTGTGRHNPVWPGGKGR